MSLDGCSQQQAKVAHVVVRWRGGSRGECCCMMDSVHQDCCGDAWCWVKFSSAKLKMILALRLVLPWILPWILPWMLLGGTLNLQPITGDDDLY